LIAVEVATAVSWFAWVIYAPNLMSSQALRAVTYVLFFAAGSFVYATCLTHYEQTGRAVRLPDHWTRTEYGSLPKPVLAVRIAFVATVAVMLVFGFAPMRESTAWDGIIATVLTMVALGLLSVLLEEYYVNIGRAQRIRVSVDPHAEAVESQAPPLEP
jgi:uncharacterized BrkB/YihY/UPF0761 family membrane protein